MRITGFVQNSKSITKTQWLQPKKVLLKEKDRHKKTPPIFEQLKITVIKREGDTFVAELSEENATNLKRSPLY